MDRLYKDGHDMLRSVPRMSPLLFMQLRSRPSVALQSYTEIRVFAVTNLNCFSL